MCQSQLSVAILDVCRKDFISIIHPASLLAVAENHRDTSILNGKFYRRMSDYAVIRANTLLENNSFKHQFPEERWFEFKKDIEYFEKYFLRYHSSKSFYDRLFSDHG